MAIIDRQGRTVDEGDVPASDYAHSGLAFKAPVRAATTADIALSGAQTIDGVAIVADDRVLVKNQSTGSENGIYLASTGPWSRVTDMDGNSEIAHGTLVFVTDGSTYALTQWYVSTANPIVIDTTSIMFTRLTAVTGPAVSVVGNVATFANTGGTQIQDGGTALTSLATQSFVTSAIDAIKNGVSAAFDTLAEIATELALKAYASVTLTAGAGLTGGGDLSANRTFTIGAGTGITVNADDVALDTSHARNVDHSAVTITAGAGLTGGGTIAATRTFDVGAGTGITVNADSVALSLNSAVLSGKPSNPTATTATSPGVMMGLGVTTLRFTPTYSSRVEFCIQGQVANGSVAATAIRLYYGTGAGPANAAATTGTAAGGGYLTYSSTAASANLGFNLSDIITGLTPGTTYWFDISVFVSAGTGTITNVTGTAKEIL